MKIIKSNGKKENFQDKKLKDIIIRIGGTQKIAEQTLQKIKQNLKNKQTSSHDIYRQVREVLSQTQPVLAKRYSLKNAILKLGPAGYNFEKYVAAILKVYGYKTQLPPELQGACVSHEVDVTLEKDGRTAMIEAKFRNAPGDKVRIKDSLSTWARYMDLLDGARIGLCPHFDESWIVTNAKFSTQSLQYGHCKNMFMIGWNHPHERTFAKMVDLQQMYPLTILNNIPSQAFITLADHDFLLCSEILQYPFTKLQKQIPLSNTLLKNIYQQSKELLNTIPPISN